MEPFGKKLQQIHLSHQAGKPLLQILDLLLDQLRREMQRDSLYYFSCNHLLVVPNLLNTTIDTPEIVITIPKIPHEERASPR